MYFYVRILSGTSQGKTASIPRSNFGGKDENIREGKICVAEINKTKVNVEVIRGADTKEKLQELIEKRRAVSKPRRNLSSLEEESDAKLNKTATRGKERYSSRSAKNSERFAKMLNMKVKDLEETIRGEQNPEVSSEQNESSIQDASNNPNQCDDDVLGDNNPNTLDSRITKPNVSEILSNSDDSESVENYSVDKNRRKNVSERSNKNSTTTGSTNSGSSEPKILSNSDDSESVENYSVNKNRRKNVSGRSNKNSTTTGSTNSGSSEPKILSNSDDSESVENYSVDKNRRKNVSGKSNKNSTTTGSTNSGSSKPKILSIQSVKYSIQEELDKLRIKYSKCKSSKENLRKKYDQLEKENQELDSRVIELESELKKVRNFNDKLQGMLIEQSEEKKVIGKQIESEGKLAFENKQLPIGHKRSNGTIHLGRNQFISEELLTTVLNKSTTPRKLAGNLIGAVFNESELCEGTVSGKTKADDKGNTDCPKLDPIRYAACRDFYEDCMLKNRKFPGRKNKKKINYESEIGNFGRYASKKISYVKECYEDQSCPKKTKKRNSGEVSSSKVKKSKKVESDSSDDSEDEVSPRKKIKIKETQKSRATQMKKQKGSDSESDVHHEQDSPTRLTVTAMIETNDKNQNHERKIGSSEDISHGSNNEKSTSQKETEEDEVEIMSDYEKSDDNSSMYSSSENE
ncbi:hypothetical protein QAD02_023155 [Eretmocerus hayati]|uniref:Uncharacterized protein n=1 Tax=Eretmocerus hayati TaxID=131215 RepID=A0ACC2PWP6_9HYME|nr:hypothetical protein QAD02_023155 [Eretmocerus hayati]